MTLPQRKNVRVPEFDYSTAGYYFITICTAKMRCVLGEVANGSMLLNECGILAFRYADEMAKHIADVRVDKFIVMPNHVHMILVVSTPANLITESPDNTLNRSKQIVPRAIQQYKAAVSRSAKITDLWQRRYYDHVVRDEDEYLKIWEYIDTNPLKWELDKYFYPPS